MADQKSLKGFLPGKDFVLGAFSMAGYIAMIQQFIDQVQQAPTPYINISNAPGASDDTKAAIKRVNDNMATHYAKIKTDAGDDQDVIKQLNLKLGSLYNIVHHAELGITFIYKEIENNATVDQTKIQSYLNYIKKAIQDADTDLNSIKVADMHTKLETDMGALNSDMSDMQTAIPADVSQKLNLTKLTEAQAKAQLDAQIKSLNDDADSLQTAITWETVGQVGIGIVGGLIAIVNFWNPIGWAAAAGTATGEVFLAKDKAQKQVQLDQDRQKITIAKEEEEILGPYYTMNQYKSQLNSLASGLEQIQTGITNIQSFVTACESDLDGFIDDLKDAQSLQLDYQAIIGNASSPGDLIQLKNALLKLMSWAPPSIVVDDVKYETMAEQGQWDKILNDPNSPYYIQYLKEASAVSAS